MITILITTERNQWIDAAVGVNEEVVFRCKVEPVPDAKYPYNVPLLNGGLERFLTYDGALGTVERQALRVFRSLHDEALGEENARELQRFIDEIAPPT